MAGDATTGTGPSFTAPRYGGQVNAGRSAGNPLVIVP